MVETNIPMLIMQLFGGAIAGLLVGYLLRKGAKLFAMLIFTSVILTLALTGFDVINVNFDTVGSIIKDWLNSESVGYYITLAVDYMYACITFLIGIIYGWYKGG